MLKVLYLLVSTLIFANDTDSFGYYKYYHEHSAPKNIKASSNNIKNLDTLAKKIKEEDTQIEKTSWHFGLGGGIGGVELYVRKSVLDVGYSIKFNQVQEKALFVKYHWLDNYEGYYNSLSIGQSNIVDDNKSTSELEFEDKSYPSLGIGVGYRWLFYELVYIDTSIKTILLTDFTAINFSLFLGLEF